MPKLANISNCTGCTACASICSKQCISMERDDSGFVYPKIDSSKCIECGACEHSCPVLMQRKELNNSPIAFAAYSTNISRRMSSSSGGVFSEIANVILEKNGYIYGAAYNEHYEICHICVENKADLFKLQGAKYAQSFLGTTFKEILMRLKSGQLVLFVGTPCQVAGLKVFLKKDYENLVCLDFVCHGVPSPMAWEEYIKYRMSKDGKKAYPISVNLRDKSTGWSKYRYSNVFQYSDGTIYSSISGENLFMKLFVGDYINRNSCSNCHFKGYSRMSDITLGDFWGIWDIAPEMDDDKGTSVILIQSEKGNRVWEEIQQNLFYKEVSLEKTSQQNPSIIKSSKGKKEREEVLKLIKKGRFEECQKLFEIPKQSFLAKIKNKIKYFIIK